MWHPTLPRWELIVRGLVVYVLVAIILRLTGKRQLGQLAPFDLVLLLVLSNAVQNAMNGGDNSLTSFTPRRLAQRIKDFRNQS